MISESEFEKIVNQIWVDREKIYAFNVNAEKSETLLWMLTSCLVSYLSLSEIETPCFVGEPSAEVYKNAVLMILKNRMSPLFQPDEYLQKLMKVD